MNKESNQKFAIQMIDITKTFLGGKVIANDKLSLKVKKNEVHALVGENGAGKSTLMSILFGIYSPDYGQILINEKQVNFNSAKDATKYGLGMVHQHFKLIDEFSVLDNIILGDEHTEIVSHIKRKQIKVQLNRLIKKYNFNINLDDKIKNLTVGQQQKVEILKLIYRNIDILIFDEPTAVLSKTEIDSFLEMIKDFQKEGKTIIIITHKLNEIKEVANWVTVIRHGKYIDDFSIDAKSISEIAESMVGSKIEEIKNDSEFDKNSEVKLSIKNLNIQKFLYKDQKHRETLPISFDVRAGEIFAIAGVEGNGQSELGLLLTGMLKDNNAQIILDGVDINQYTIDNRFQNGLSAIPEDRHKHGLVLDLPISFNAVIHDLSKEPISTHGFIKENNILKRSTEIISKYDVRGTTRGTSVARNLSGGNQQKLIIGREMERNFELLLLSQPTRGMDLGAISFIHKKILEAKANKKAVILISYELDEIIGLADTIAIMQNGLIVQTGSKKEMTRQKIGELMMEGTNIC